MSSDTTPTDTPGPVAERAADITVRSQKLLHEMEQLRQRLFDLHGENHHLTGLVSQISTIRTEKTAAETYLASLADPSVKWKGSILRFTNSNVPAVEQLWNIVKRCRHVTSFGHQINVTPKALVCKKSGTVLHKPGPETLLAGRGGKKGVPFEDLSIVNATVDGGAEWLKIITTTERRLLHEMAEGGWDWGGDGDESDDEGDATLFQEIEILRTAAQLVNAARNNWHKYKHPRIRFILTRLQEGHNSEVDRLLRKLRSMEGHEITVNFHFADSEWVANEAPIPFDTAISNMLPQPDDMTDTIVLDTSVLIALASDITHTQVTPQLWHENDARAQIKAEADGDRFLLNAYPRLCGRKLICTKEAARQFLQITNTIGSPDEMARASQLLEGRRQHFQKLSIHAVPEDLELPIQVLPEEATTASAYSQTRTGTLPHVALEIARHLQDNYTHLYGWRMGLTVITGNRVLANKIVRIVEDSLSRENGNRDYDNGPRICALSQNRALFTRGPSLKKANKLARQGLWPPVHSSQATFVVQDPPE